MAKLKKETETTTQESVADEPANTTSDETTAENNETAEPATDSKKEQEETAQRTETNGTDGGIPAESAAVNDAAKTPQPAKTTPAPAKKAQERAKERGYEEPDSYILSILEAYKSYESLYVDRSGSVYTVDTPERIRGGAKLYKNPHFKNR